MRLRGHAVFGIVVLLIGLAAPAASAKETVDAMLARASKLEGEAAAKTLGKIARKFQGDLAAEKKIATEIERVLMKADTPDGAVLLSKMLVALMGELDATRSGAYVSAHALAREALITATRSGEFLAVPAAAKVLKTYAKGRNRGLSALSMRIFSQALEAREKADGDRKKLFSAGVNLEVALSHFTDNQWFEMATIAATEVAAVHLATDMPELAVEAIERAAASPVTPSPDQQVVFNWDNTLRRRIPDISPALRAPVKALLAKLQGQGPVSGGRGGKAKPGVGEGEDPATDLGRAWRRMKGRAPILTVRRKETTLVGHLEYVRAKDPSWPIRVGQRFVEIGDVLVSLHGMAIALEGMDLRKPGSAPGGSSPIRNRFRAWTLLGEDEVWSVGKDGLVRVRG